MSAFPQRKSPRLQGYDYSQVGAYFITICTHEREQMFGKIVQQKMKLSRAGEIASQRWLDLPSHHSNIELDAFIVMPNHIHGIVVILDQAASLSTIIQSYKSSVTRHIRQAYDEPEWIIWQKRYYDHIIRNKKSLTYIQNYVLNNPRLWEDDTFYA